MSKINTNAGWDALEDAYATLMAEQGLDDEQPVNPDGLQDYDYETAASEAMASAATAYPELAILAALADNGYLEGHQIWDEIIEAITEGIQEMTEDRWEEYGDSDE